MLEHRVEDVASSACQADEGGVVFLSFGAFAVVVGAAGGVVQCGECGEEEGAFEFRLPNRAGCSPRMEVPDRWVTGAMPA